MTDDEQIRAYIKSLNLGTPNAAAQQLAARIIRRSITENMREDIAS